MFSSESGQEIELLGKSGETYQGKIYPDKESASTLSGKAIVCLTNSWFSKETWHHHMNSVYNTDDVNSALEHFKNRDDISHLILIPRTIDSVRERDEVDDLIRQYLHG